MSDEPPFWKMLQDLIRWLHRKRCAACGKREPLDTHHNLYRGKVGEHGREEPGDLIPLCWWCHPLFEWMRSPLADIFKGTVRRLLAKTRKLRLFSRRDEGRLHVTREQVSQVVGAYAESLRDRLDCLEFKYGEWQAELSEIEHELAIPQTMADAWDREDEEHGKRRAA